MTDGQIILSLLTGTTVVKYSMLTTKKSSLAHSLYCGQAWEKNNYIGIEYLNQLLCLNKVIGGQIMPTLLSGISMVNYSLLATKRSSLEVQCTADRHGNSNAVSIEYLT